MVLFTMYYNSNEHICCFASFAKKQKLNVHYDNTPVNCKAIFGGCKNGDFQMKNLMKFALTSIHDICFRAGIKKSSLSPVKLTFPKIKWDLYGVLVA